MFNYNEQFSRLEEIGRISNTDKVTYNQYHRYYSRIIPLLPDGPILEIGYGSGASVKFWRMLFPNREFYCLDLDVEYSEPGVHVIKCDQSSPQSLDSVLDQLMGKSFALIIDDGSHHPDHQILSFNMLFPLLSELGTYVIEDIETSYWIHTNVYGYRLNCGLFSRSGIIERFKYLIDFTNRQFLAPSSLHTISKRLISSSINPSVCIQIHDILFAHNFIAITKSDSCGVLAMSNSYRFPQAISTGIIRWLGYYLPSPIKQYLKNIISSF